MIDSLFPKDTVVDQTVVWRVETVDGAGPYHYYCDPADRDACEWRNYAKWYHLMPNDEDGIKQRYARLLSEEIVDDIFAFPNVGAYIRWFNKAHWRKHLEKHGLKLIAYRARNVAVGQNQCIFNRKKAQKLAEYSPTAFDAQFGDYWEFR